MNSNDKTLADVQPGGRVRLGDALPPLPCTGYSAYSDGTEPLYTAEQMQNYARAALSAQPSPGGQGDLKSRFTQWVKANSYNPATFASGRFMGDGVQIAWEAVQALAARQPMGQIDEAAVLRRAAAVLYMWEDDPNLTGYMGDFNDACGILELLAQHAAPPAQAVDLGQFRDAVAYAARSADFATHVEIGSKLRELLALIDSKAVGK